MATILIVDDSDNFRHMLELVFKNEGHDVIGAASGAEAIALAAKAKMIDLVIADQVMPGMPGTTLAQRLRVVASTRAAQIVILTATMRRKDVEEAKESGAAGWLSKPIDLVRLKAYVKAVLAGDFESLKRIASGGKDAA